MKDNIIFIHLLMLLIYKYSDYEFYTCIFIKSMLKCIRRCSILVGMAIFQEGPKNPLKGTSMKSLVSAFYAQFRVGAGG